MITEKEIEELAEEAVSAFTHSTELAGKLINFFILGYKAALQNKVSDAPKLDKEQIIKEAKRLWNIPTKVEAVKLVMKLGYSLKDAKAYCEDNFDSKVSDVSADTKNEEDLIYRIVENWGNVVYPVSEMVKWLKEYASNERKENIPSDFKEVTGHNTPKEMMAYEKGREDEQQVISEWIEKWDGSTNSVMGALLKKKFNELFTCRSKQTNNE